uniref:Rab-GAP TBC domain-containing protein n=1 Tax=Ditylenchus dipsaci TaxID=166011 RepID=A0A915E940_9BILA
MMKNNNNTSSSGTSVSSTNQTSSSNSSSTSSSVNNPFLFPTQSSNSTNQPNGRQKQRKPFEKLLSEGADLQEIEKFCIEGNLRDSRFRSTAWRILLKVQPRRDSLHELDVKVNNPLALQQENPWQQFFVDSDLRECINKDVERTCPDVAFFQSQSIRQIMSDILFIHSKLVSHISYRQAHAHAKEQQEADSQQSSSAEKSLFNCLNDPTYLEHDAFAIFRQLMMLIEGWYDAPLHTGGQTPMRRMNMGKPSCFNSNKFTKMLMEAKNSLDGDLAQGLTPFSSSPRSIQIQEAEALTHLSLHRSPMQSELQQKLEYIHEKLLNKIDPKLFAHLTALEIAPQVYGIRWLRLLFGREFPIHDLLFLWDVILAENSGGRNGPSDLAFVDYVFVALLVQISHLLVNADYTSCIQYLMRYPPTADIHAFINLALHLQSPKKYPRPANLVVSHIHCCHHHSSATTHTNQAGENHRHVHHHYHQNAHIFPHITLAGETHPNVERRQQHQRKLSTSSAKEQPAAQINHHRHSQNADFTGGVIGHAAATVGKQQPAVKSSIENVFTKIGRKALQQSSTNSSQQPSALSEPPGSLHHRRNTADSSIQARKSLTSGLQNKESEMKEVRTKRAHTNASTAVDVAKTAGTSSIFYYDTAEDFYKRDSFHENSNGADVELMKEQIALLQSRLNDVDMQAQLSARSIEKCCEQLKQIYATDDEDSIEKAVAKSSLEQDNRSDQTGDLIF